MLTMIDMVCLTHIYIINIYRIVEGIIKDKVFKFIFFIFANKTNTNIEIVMEVKEKMKKWLAIVLGIIIVFIVIRALIIWVL